MVRFLSVVALVMLTEAAAAQSLQPMSSAQLVAQQIGQLVIQNAQLQEKIAQLEQELAKPKADCKDEKK